MQHEDGVTLVSLLPKQLTTGNRMHKRTFINYEKLYKHQSLSPEENADYQ